MNNRDLLVAVRTLIEDPAQWTTHVSGRDKKGEAVMPTDPTCVAWCMSGAFARAVDEAMMWPEPAENYLTMASRLALVKASREVLAEESGRPIERGQAGQVAITELNDLGRHDLVTMVLDRAIEEVA